VSKPDLRLLADDLTGALDSAAAFGSEAEPVAVRWSGAVPPSGSVAFDSGTRERGAEEARSGVGAIAPTLWSAGQGLAFKKIDSLLRGNEAVEIAEIAERLAWDRVVIAPAFPAEGRLTRGGSQYVLPLDEAGRRDAGLPVATDLAAELRAAGKEVVLARPGDPAPYGLSLWDAETDSDLDAIVADMPVSTLFVGTAGLAAALARRWGGGTSPRAPERLSAPILALIGSNHPAMLAQMNRIGSCHLLASDSEAGMVENMLSREVLAAVGVALPDGISRQEAAARIDPRFAALTLAISRPGALFVAGGETLRGLCTALGAEHLDVIGEMMPGVPRSVMRGGRWDGIAVMSKSGAFGAPDLLERLAERGRPTPAGAAA